MFCKYFSQSIVCFLTVFLKIKLFSLFSFMVYDFCILSKKTLPIQVTKILAYIFL